VSRAPSNVAAAAALALAMVGPASAQRPDSARRDSTPVPAVLEPITVRAGAAAAPALPLSRSTVEAGDLGAPRAAAGLDEALARVPGVSAQNRYNFALDTRIAIRGFGARSAFGVRGVTVVLDGVPQTLPDGQTQLQLIEPAALARVDVVRGAAAALYGNAAGGVLALSTAPLLAARTVARARLVAGSFGLVQWHGEARAPLAGGGVGLELSRLTTDGFRAHSAADLRHGAAAIELPLTGAMRVAARVRVGDLARAENPGALDSAQLDADPSQAVARNVAFAAGKTVRQWQGSAELRQVTPRADATLLAYLARRDLDNPLPTAWVRLRRDGGGARLLLRHAVGRAELLAGADLQVMRDRRRNVDNDSGTPGDTLRLDQRETVGALGARAGLAWPLRRGTRAFAGLRYDRVAYRVEDRLVADGDDSGARTLDAVSAMAGLTHALTGVLRLRASVGTAFETPTTTELADPGRGGLNLDLEPQRTLQWDAGVDVASAGLRAGLAVYHAAVKDGVVPYEVAAAPGRFVYRNAARLAHRGVEADVEARATPWLRLVAAYTRTAPRFERFPTDTTPLDGNAVPGVPRWSGYLALGVGRAAGPGVTLELVGQGRTWADDANTAAADAWSVIHVRAGWPVAWGALLVQLFGGVNNLADARYVSAVSVNGARGRFFEPAPGRNWYVGVESSWEKRER
jgi:iron complex outermembrane receptor protein